MTENRAMGSSFQKLNVGEENYMVSGYLRRKQDNSKYYYTCMHLVTPGNLFSIPFLSSNYLIENDQISWNSEVLCCILMSLICCTD